MAGKFICIEGGEGCGKTTMTRVVAKWLAAEGCEVREVSDPGETPLARRLREIVKDGSIPCNPAQQALLYIAARSSLAEEVYQLLEQGVYVVSGRWTPTTLIYQGLLGGVGVPQVQHLADSFVSWNPDLYIVLDATPEIALERKRAATPAGVFENDRFDSRNLAWHRMVRAGYLDHARQHNYPVIDADRPLAEVEADVLKACAGLLNCLPPASPI